MSDSSFKSGTRRWLWQAYIAVVVTASVAAWIKGATYSSSSLYDLSYMMGSTALSLRETGSFAVQLKLSNMVHADGSLVFAAHRRPMIPSFLAVVSFLSTRVTVALLIKNLLCFGLLVDAGLRLRALVIPRNRRLFTLACGLLLAIPSLTSQLIGIEIEEAYTIPIMTWIFVVALEAIDGRARHWHFMLPVLLAILVLTKSSLILPCVVVAVGFGWITKSWAVAGRASLGIIGALMVVIGLNGVQSGRFTTSSSIDWYNAYKGANPLTEQYYGSSRLDDLPVQLDRPAVNEWDFSDQFRDRTLEFVRTNPYTWARLAVAKVYNFYIRADFTPSDSHFRDNKVLRFGWFAGNVVFRLMMWLALGWATLDVYRMMRRSGNQQQRPLAGAFFVCLCAAYSAPYIIGFAYLRHAIVIAPIAFAFLAWRALGSTALSVAPPRGQD